MSTIVEYASLFSKLKEKVFQAQKNAISSVNSELVILYWEIGNTILKNQSAQGWGAKIIDSLSNDLKKTFPKMKGFSVRNLKYMRQFASIYNDVAIVQELLAQLSWYHNLTLMQIKRQNRSRIQFERYKQTNRDFRVSYHKKYSCGAKINTTNN